jgi:methionine-rich copper-binding protein CopC
MTAPDLTGTYPSDGAQVQPVDQIRFTLSDRYGTVDDDATGGSVLVKDALDRVIDGAVSEANDQFTFTPDVLPLDDGIYTVAFTAVDQDANTAEYSFSFTVDSQPPAVPIITGGEVYSGVIQVQPAVNRSNAASITLTGIREENTSVWVNGIQQVAVGSGDWSKPLNLNQGDNILTITLKDRAGNESDPATVEVLVDSIAPTVASVTPADNSLLNTVPESFTIEYTEAASGLNMANTIRIIRDAGYQDVPGQWDNLEGSRLVFTPNDPFADSAYTINIQLEDNLVNQGPALTYRFELDTLAPAAPVVAPVVSPTHNPTQTIIGSKAADASILLNGQVIIANTPVTALSLDEEGDGTTIAMDWRFYDEPAHGDVGFYEIYVEAEQFTDVGGLTAKDTVPSGQFTYTAEGLSRDTTYYFAVVAVDLAGNFLTAVTPVAGVPVDMVPPKDVTGLDVERSETELIFSWEPSADSDDDLAGYMVYFDVDTTGVSLDPSMNNYAKAGLMPATAYPFRVTAVDNDGNESDGADLTAATLMAKPAGVVGERGVIAELSHEQQTVLLTVAYQNPVVFAQMVSTNGSDPAVVRITDVQSERFTVKIQEVPGTADDGAHALETVNAAEGRHPGYGHDGRCAVVGRLRPRRSDAPLF